MRRVRLVRTSRIDNRQLLKAPYCSATAAIGPDDNMAFTAHDRSMLSENAIAPSSITICGSAARAPALIERLTIVRLECFKVRKSRKIVERQFRRLKVQRSGQQPLQNLAATEVAEIAGVGMRDQPRAVAFGRLGDPSGIKISCGQQRNASAPMRAAQRHQVGFDRGRAIQP